MSSQEVKQIIRNNAYQSLYAAQFMAAYGDASVLKSIAKMFVQTEAGLQPLVAEIELQRDMQSQSFTALRRGWDVYQQNSKLINDWMKK